jgi:hypothetical protein
MAMAISVTCSCGARLELDDKFAGKAIPCPDCQQPLNTKVAADESRQGQISGLAIASLILAMVGAFTIVGSLAAIVVGYFAMRQIAREPERFSGLNFARGGMIAGGLFTLVTLGLLLSNDVFGVDSLLRELRHASQLQYKTEAGGLFKIQQVGRDNDYAIPRPSSAWAKLDLKGDDLDLLTLVNLREDAHLVCLSMVEQDEESALDKAAEKLRSSGLFKFLNRPEAKAPTPEPEPRKVPENKNELIVDVRVGNYDRTFLLRVVKGQKGGDIFLLAAGTRKGRFGRIVDDVRRAFDKFQVVD